MDDLTLGQRISEQRKKLGLSQEALGEKLGLSRQAISKWESDAAVPEIDKLIVLSKLFDTSIGWLLGVEEKPEAIQSGGSLSDEQLCLIEELVKKHQPKPMLPLRAVVPFICMILLLTTHIYRLQTRIDTVNYRYDTLQSLHNDLSARMQQLEATNQTPAAVQTPAPTLLADYKLEIASIVSGDNPEANISFTAVPALWQAGDSATLSARREGAGTLSRECEWDGAFLTARLPLPAADGYELCLTVTHSDGTQEQQVLNDYAIQNLKTSLSLTASVTPGKWNWENDTISLRNYEFQVTMPQSGKFYGSIQWKTVDVILTYADGEEIGRFNLLSADKEEDADILASTDFWTMHGEINFVGLELKPNAGILLWLSAETNNGLTLMEPADGWTTNAEGRPLHTTVQ